MFELHIYLYLSKYLHRESMASQPVFDSNNGLVPNLQQAITQHNDEQLPNDIAVTWP